MDKREAMEILRQYRPGANDGQDPKLAEALQLAQQDAELAGWLQGKRGFYAAMQAGLKAIPVPAELKEKILLNEARRRGRIVWLRLAVAPLAIAAAVALLAVALWPRPKPVDKNSFTACRENIVKKSQRNYAMTMTNTDLGAIHEYLLAKQCPDYVLTKPLARLAGEGCATLEWHNRKISMVCLKDGKDKELFLFVMDGEKLPNAPVAREPEYAKVLRLMTASWAEGGKVYILAGPGDESELKRYLD